jgi:hypothetical protein
MTDEEKIQISPRTICISLDDDPSTDPHSLSTQKLSIQIVSVEPTISRPGHLYPEWSPKANLAVVGAFVALFFAFGLMNAFGTFQTWYATHQLKHLPPSTISWIGSLQLWTFFFSVRAKFLSHFLHLMIFVHAGCAYRTTVRRIWAYVFNDCRNHLLRDEHRAH